MTRSRPTSAIRRVNANGMIYGATENSTDMVPVLDPVTHTAYEVKLPVLDPKTPSTVASADDAVGVLGRRADLGRADQSTTT